MKDNTIKTTNWYKTDGVKLARSNTAWSYVTYRDGKVIVEHDSEPQGGRVRCVPLTYRHIFSTAFLEDFVDTKHFFTQYERFIVYSILTEQGSTHTPEGLPGVALGKDQFDFINNGMEGIPLIFPHKMLPILLKRRQWTLCRDIMTENVTIGARIGFCMIPLPL